MYTEQKKSPGAETIVQKDSHEAEFERMSDEELIKAIEERANKLGIKINLRYDFGSGRSDDAQWRARYSGPVQLGLAVSLSRRQRYRPRSWMVLAGRPYSSRALEVMQRNFGKTVNADGNDRCPDTDRGITHHIAMFPRARPHMPWQN